MAEERFDGVDLGTIFIEISGGVVCINEYDTDEGIELSYDEMDKLTQLWIERKVNLNK